MGKKHLKLVFVAAAVLLAVTLSAASPLSAATLTCPDTLGPGVVATATLHITGEAISGVSFTLDESDNLTLNACYILSPGWTLAGSGGRYAAHSAAAPVTALDVQLSFTVDAVTAYSPAFYVFMDIDSMRELFDAPKDYYNVVFSDHALDIPAGRLYSVTDRAAVAKAGDVFVALMMPMVWSMVGCTSLILAVVLYLMMKVTVDRSSYGIALFKIFGYRRGEIRRLYLSGTFWLIAVGAAVGIPLAKKIMDSLYPYLVSNVNCGMDLRYSWPLYAAIYIGVLLIYVITERLLVGRVDRISPNEVLKNRE